MTIREFRKICCPQQFVIIEFEKENRVISLETNYKGYNVTMEDLVLMYKKELLDSEIKGVSSRILKDYESAIVLFVDYKEI